MRAHKSVYRHLEPLIPVGVTLYRNDAVVEFRAPGNGGGGSRKDVLEFSRQSRNRLAFVAANTDCEFRSMATLTYPAEFPLEGRESKRHLRSMLARFRRRFEGVQYLWFMEFQKRGAVHYHVLLTAVPGQRDLEWLSGAWYVICNTADPKHCRAGTNWEPCRSPGGASRYAVKYASKMRQKSVPPEYRNCGRFWGCTKLVAPTPIATVTLGDDIELRDLLAGWQYIDRVLASPCKTLYNAAATVASNYLRLDGADIGR